MGAALGAALGVKAASLASVDASIRVCFSLFSVAAGRNREHSSHHHVVATEQSQQERGQRRMERGQELKALCAVAARSTAKRIDEGSALLNANADADAPETQWGCEHDMMLAAWMVHFGKDVVDTVREAGEALDTLVS